MSDQPEKITQAELCDVLQKMLDSAPLANGSPAPDCSLSVLRELVDAIERFGGGASMMHPRLTRAISKAKKHAAENTKDSHGEAQPRS